MPKCCQCQCFKSYCSLALARYNYSRPLGHCLGYSSRRGATPPPLSFLMLLVGPSISADIVAGTLANGHLKAHPLPWGCFGLEGHSTSTPPPPAYSIILWFPEHLNLAASHLVFMGFEMIGGVISLLAGSMLTLGSCGSDLPCLSAFARFPPSHRTPPPSCCAWSPPTKFPNGHYCNVGHQHDNQDIFSRRQVAKQPSSLSFNK